jgi:hypothetical protein
MSNRTPGRIDLSFRPKDNLELLQRILDKHTELGDASPLKQIVGIDLRSAKDKTPEALTAHLTAEHHKKQMELQYAQRDALMVELKHTLRKTIALLKATYAGNPKTLGEWGVEVNDTVRKPRAKKNQ